jgi:apyrase
VDAGIIKDTSIKQQDTTPQAFLVAAQKACSTTVQKIPKAFPAVPEDGAPYLCLDLTLQYSLLTAGLKIPKDHKITLVKQVAYRGDFFEAAWPLGAAINTLSS